MIGFCGHLQATLRSLGLADGLADGFADAVDGGVDSRLAGAVMERLVAALKHLFPPLSPDPAN